MRPLVFFVSIIIFTSAYAKEKYVLRKVHWSMTKAEVMRSEMPAMAAADSEDRILYKDILFGSAADVSFLFYKDSLTAVVYRVSIERYDAEKYHALLLASLANKYGKAMTRFGIQRYRKGMITLIRQQHSSIEEFILVYSNGAIESVSLAALKKIQDAMALIEKKQITADIENKL